MAPEDRSTWTDEARTEFFGSLFGGQGGLGGGGGHDDVEEGYMYIGLIQPNTYHVLNGSVWFLLLYLSRSVTKEYQP